MALTYEKGMSKLSKCMKLIEMGTVDSMIEFFLAHPLLADMELEDEHIEVMVSVLGSFQNRIKAMKVKGMPKPAKELSEYHRFVKTEKERIKATEPDMTPKEILAQARANWKEAKVANKGGEVKPRKAVVVNHKAVEPKTKKPIAKVEEEDSSASDLDASSKKKRTLPAKPVSKTIRTRVTVSDDESD
jgi:hypothetical protein